MLKSFLNKFYKLLNGESAKNTAIGITEDASAFGVGNYFKILLSFTFTKLGDTLSNPKTVLTWLMGYVSAPVYLISLIVPIRESGSMLPQIVISNYVKTKRIRKWIWVFGSIVQAIAISAIGFISLYTEGTLAGWLIVVCLVVFSLARSLCSVTSKDITGKTITKTVRGKLSGYTASFSGVLVLIAGLYMIYQSRTDATITFYSSLIFFAACMWIIATLIYATIKEFPGDADDDSLEEHPSSKFALLKNDKPFRDFVIARSLLLCSALSAPFYVLLAQKYLGNSSSVLGQLIIANGIASIVSAPFWGRLADKSSKNTMSYAISIASVLGIVLVLIVVFSEAIRTSNWLYPTVFFILGISHGGVRLGRKTYVVNMAKGNQRTDYVAVSNTIIGIILLITGSLSALASVFSIELVLFLLAVLGVFGAIKSYRLKPVE